MLKGISWGQFSIFLLVVTVGYYLYVLVAYYRADVLARFVGGRGGKRGQAGLDGAGGTGSLDGVGPHEGDTLADFREDTALTNSVNEPFRLTEQAIGVLRRVIKQTVDNKMDRENLLEHIKEVLSGYRQLRKTEYADAISNFLIRECLGELSMKLTEEDVNGLWK